MFSHKAKQRYVGEPWKTCWQVKKSLKDTKRGANTNQTQNLIQKLIKYKRNIW